MSIFDVNGNPISSGGTNCKIIAHRGYFVDVAQNTIAAFKAAAEAGFKWIEVDTRQTADGVFVMAHDNSVTMYNDGVQTSVTIGSSNYSTIKNYTWDQEGEYKLSTLLGSFNAMKAYDMMFIIDRKAGTNDDIMKIAAMAGAVDRVMLSYSGFHTALDEVGLLKKFDNVPIRVWTSATRYPEYLQLVEQISNPIYADVTATSVGTSMSTAFACGIPILFNSCKTNNKGVWAVVANGVMAYGDENISYNDFLDAISIDYDVSTEIVPSVQTVSVEEGADETITASSDYSGFGGYVYGYTFDPRIAKTEQTAFGQNATFIITGVSAGTTTLRLFDGCGYMIDIPVNVS